jgi:hypothetical protein
MEVDATDVLESFDLQTRLSSVQFWGDDDETPRVLRE